MLEVERLESGAVSVLRFSGDIDEGTVDVVRTAIVGCIQDQRFNVVVNLSGVKYISYMGLGVLVERLRQLRAHDGDLKLSGVNLYTQRLIRMVGAKNVFETFEIESQAINQFRRAA